MAVNTQLFCLVFMHLPSCLALIELAVHRDGGQQLLVRANRRFAVPHENNVLQLREVIQPVRDQEDDLMDCVLHDKTPQAGDAFETTFNNGACDVTAFLIAPEVIDKDNYQAVLFDSGYYSEDQLK